MLTIGQIAYANCTPIFTALRRFSDCSGLRFVQGVPAELNELLVRGDLDVCPSSSIVYARHPEKYYLLPGLSISSIGPVKSVLLFSRYSLEELDGRTIGLSTESATSVNLLRIILSRQFGFTNDFRNCCLAPATALESLDAILLIGDGALRGGAQGLEGVRVYDLGELWLRFTGLPFVFALWMATDKAVRENGDEMRKLANALVTAKQRAYEAYEEIARSCTDIPWISPEGLVDYWRTISYDLTAEHVAGVCLFYRYAAEMGLLEREPEIRFLE